MDEVIRKLSDASSIEFYKGLSFLRKIPSLHGPEGAEVLLTAAQILSSECAVPNLEQAERVEAMLAALSLNAEGQKALAAQAFSRLPIYLLNSLAKVLAPLQKKELIRSGEPHHPEVVEPIPNTAAVEIEEVRFNAAETEPVDATRCNGATVILLSINPQESNKQLLQKNGYAVFKYDTFEKCNEDFQSNSDVCACIVDESFLSPLSKEQQKEFLSKLSSLSTLLWIRIDERGLKLTHEEVWRIIKIAQCKSTIRCEDLSIQHTGTIRETELHDIFRAQEIVRIGDSVQLIPSELTKSELRLLVSAVKEHYQRYDVEEVVALESVETRFLQGGYASAKIILVNITGADNFIVAKVGNKEQIFDEIGRYRHFIREWNDTLRPVVSFHSSSAVILFNFIVDGANGAKPAPVLEGTIDDLWISELYTYIEQDFELKVKNLCIGFNRFASSLSTLNKKSPRIGSYQSQANPPISFIVNLEDRGINWGLSDSDRSARAIAQQQFDHLAFSGIVHGDLHFKNILVRNELDFFLIDYAGSGPGHPAVDICRMMIALFSVYLKQQMDEAEYAPIVYDIFISRKSTNDILTTYPMLKTPRTNEVCISGCIDSREAAIDVVTAHNGDFNDYIAAITLVAWQNLLITGRQVSLLKILIRQLSNYLLMPQSVST